jgi:O-antigen/teichoic acid export membrane protein
MVGLSILMAAVLTRHLGVGRFGFYTTVMSVAAVVAAVTDAGISTFATREYAVMRGAERDALMADLLTVRVALTLCGVAFTTGFALAAGYQRALVFGAVTAGLATVPLAVQHTLTIPLQADLRLGAVAALDLARQVLWVGAVVALSTVGAGVFPLLSILLAVNLILIVPTARLVRGRISIKLAFRPSVWPQLLVPTAVYSVATAVGVIYAYMAQILTSLVTSHHQSGLFAVSFRVFVVSVTVPAMLAGAALPVLARAARDDPERLRYALQRIFDMLVLAGIGAALAISAGSGFIVSVIAGSAYSASAPVLAIQATALVGSFLAAGWSFALLSLRLHRELLAANGAALVVSTVLTLALARSGGAQGAAIASVCGEATLAAGTGLALFGPRREFRPQLGVAMKAVVAGAIAGVIAMAPPMPSVARAVVAVAVYGLALVGLKAVPSELRELLSSDAWRLISSVRPPRSRAGEA